MRELGPWFGLTGRASTSAARVVVLGCPFEGGEAFRGGAAVGPSAIRRWSATAEAVDEELRAVEGLRVVDLGDVELSVEDRAAGGEGRWRAIEAAAGAALAAHDGAFLLGLGGDHAVTPPLASAVRAATLDPGFVLLDAHPDAFDAYDGDALSHACVLPRLWDRGGFEPGRTAVVGVRSAALEELPVLERVGLTLGAVAWRRLGAAEVARRVREATGGRPLYVSLDIDVLDAAAAPGTGYPIAGGPSARDLLELLAALWERQPVVAMDLVEVAPALDQTGVTAATAAHLLLQVLGWVARRPR